MFLQSLIFVTHYCLVYRQTHRLKKIQNTAARIVKKSPRRNHITPILCDLHWLPITSRIDFKILVITFCGLRFNQPPYIGELIHLYVPSRNLRSMNSDRLVQPRSNIKFYGGKCFAFAAATLWNNLPESVRLCDTLIQFKRSLKNLYFQTSIWLIYYVYLDMFIIVDGNC